MDVLACGQRRAEEPTLFEGVEQRHENAATVGAAGGAGMAAADVVVHAGPVRLGGELTVPEGATGIVVFAHGSGSSRHSPRNRSVSTSLNKAGLATLLFDLLTAEEELDRANTFDTALLAYRLTDATRWLLDRPETQGLAVGYFGASTGAAAALWAAAEPDSPAVAVVSRGGRPDLAGPRLPHGDRAHAAHRRRRRRGGAGPQPPGPGAAAL